MLVECLQRLKGVGKHRYMVSNAIQMTTDLQYKCQQKWIRVSICSFLKIKINERWTS